MVFLESFSPTKCPLKTILLIDQLCFHLNDMDIPQYIIQRDLNCVQPVFIFALLWTLFYKDIVTLIHILKDVSKYNLQNAFNSGLGSMKFMGLEVRVAIVFSHIKRIFSHLCLITKLSIRRKSSSSYRIPFRTSGYSSALDACKLPFLSSWQRKTQRSLKGSVTAVMPFPFSVFNSVLELLTLSTKCLSMILNYSKHDTVTCLYDQHMTCLGIVRQWVRRELLTSSSFKTTLIHLILN